ncbi:ATP-grasp domain-containing protein [Paenibacillus jilunlii]|nr:ATP-grasp domain-containing protein [Paenibacillus jilunlii]
MEMIIQQEQQMIFLSRPDDTLMFRHNPDECFISYLQGHGIEIPVIRRISDTNSLPWSDMRHGRKTLLVPYIVNEAICAEAYHNAVSVYGSDPFLVKRFNDKFQTRRLAAEIGFNLTKGDFCTNERELIQTYRMLREQGFEKTVLKVPFGSSGKGMRIIKDETSFTQMLQFIGRRRKDFELLLEGWHPIKRSMNCQLLIEAGRVTILGITEQKIDEYGIYLGSDFTPSYEKAVLNSYSDSMMKLGNRLMEMGYSGIAGVDSIIDDKDELIPVIEINARFTQVTYLLPLVWRLRQQHRYVLSRFIRGESAVSYGFDEICAAMTRNASGGSFLIYNFAKAVHAGKSVYRIFFLVYGNDLETVERTMHRLEQFSFM